MAVSGIEGIGKKIVLYRSIPVYPMARRINTLYLSDSSAPICQGENNEISFIDAMSKDRYMKKLYAKRKQLYEERKNKREMEENDD